MSSSLVLSRRLLRTLPHWLPRLFSTASIADNTTATGAAGRGSVKHSLEQLYQERDYDRLTEKFKELSKKSPFRSKHKVYEDTILRLAAANRLSNIEDIIEEQKKNNNHPSAEGFYLRLISLYGRAGMPGHALKLFDEMPTLGCVRTIKSVNAILTAFYRSKDAEKVGALFEELTLKLKLKPDGYTYNILAQSFCEAGNVDLAFSLLDQMKENDIAPNWITFNILIQGFYAQNRGMDAEKVWTEMKNSGIEPVASTFNAKMRGLVAGGKIKEAVEVIHELESSGLKPNVTQFGTLIKAYCEAGNLVEPKKLLCEMTERDLHPSRSTLEKFISHLCKGNEDDLCMAYELCLKALRRNTFVNVGVLQTAIDKLSHLSMDDKAKRLLNLAAEKKFYGSNLKMAD